MRVGAVPAFTHDFDIKKIAEAMLGPGRTVTWPAGVCVVKCSP